VKPTSLNETLETLFKRKTPTGKLLWRDRRTVGHDTKTDHMGKIQTEITYEVPVVFDKEDVQTFSTALILGALEYSVKSNCNNMLYVKQCTIAWREDKALNVKNPLLVVSIIFSDFGPAKETT